MNGARIRNYGCRIKDDILYKGMRTVFLENDVLRAGVLVDKGTDVFEFLYKPGDMDFTWLYPWGLTNPTNYRFTKNQTGGRYLDFYEGGWQEIFPNGGGPCSVAGAEFGQHDEVALLPWEYEIIEDKKEKIEIKFFTKTRLTPFLLEKRIKLEEGNPEIKISERIINKSSVCLKVIWGYHLVYGKPFLEEGCKININAKKCLTHNIPGVLDFNIPLNREFMWPLLPTTDGETIDLSIIQPESTNSSKFLYINEIETGEYEILNEKKNLGIKVVWDKKIMPYLWFWQEFNNSTGYPWYKMARVLGFEPFSTNISGLDNTIKEGKGLIIGGDLEKDFYINISVIRSRDKI